MGKTILGLLVTMVTVSVATAMTPITCTAGEFSKCQTGSVTCHFHENIKKSKKNFNIVQYPFNKGSSNSDAGTYVLVCNWGQGEALDCKTEDGFGFNKQVSDTITLDVLDVKSSVGGVYVCQLVPDGGIPLETCTLKVKDLVYQYPTDVCPDVNCGSEEVIIAVLILILIILIILLVFVIVYIRKRFTCVRKLGDPKTDRCICCAFTYSFKRRTQSEITSTPESAVLSEYNEAKREKRVGATPEGAPLLAGSKSDLTSPPASSHNPTNTGPGVSFSQQGAERGSTGQSAVEAKQNALDEKNDGAGSGKKSGPSDNTRPSAKIKAREDIGGPPPKKQIKASGYADWTTEEVAQWLRQERFEDHVIDSVTNAKFTGQQLLDTNPWWWWDSTGKHLQELKPGLDKKLVKQIHSKVKELRAAEAAQAAAESKRQKQKEEEERKELERKSKKK